MDGFGSGLGEGGWEWQWQKKWLLPGYQGLYLAEAFRNLGLSLVGVFLPVYLFQVTGELFFVFLYFALCQLTVLVSNFPAAGLVRRWGVDLVTFAAMLLRATSLFLLLRVGVWPGAFWWSAAVWGLAIAAHRLSFNYAFTVAERGDGKYGQEVGRLGVICRMASLAGPLVGGMIVVFFGFESLFVFAMILIAFSGIPTFFDTVKSESPRLSWEKIVTHMRNPKRKGIWVSLGGRELRWVVLETVWPLFVFTVVANYQTLGVIKSVASLAGIVSIWSLGRWVDRRGKSVMRLGVILNGLNLLLRPFLQNPLALFLTETAYEVTGSLTSTPFEAAFFEKAARMHKLEWVLGTLD